MRQCELANSDRDGGGDGGTRGCNEKTKRNRNVKSESRTTCDRGGEMPLGFLRLKSTK